MSSRDDSTGPEPNRRPRVNGHEVARAGRGAFAHLAAGRSMVDELIADRRAEAALEDASSTVPPHHKLG